MISRKLKSMCSVIIDAGHGEKLVIIQAVKNRGCETGAKDPCVGGGACQRRSRNLLFQTSRQSSDTVLDTPLHPIL